MERDPLKRLDEFRNTEASELDNALIDEFLTGQASRADFLRHASVIGLSATAIGAALGTAGYAAPAQAAARAVKAGGRLRLGVIPGPTGDLEPHQFADHGRLATGTICGEFLTATNQDNTLSPRLALNWKPNKTGTQWAFNLRQGVKFQDGSPLTAADVIATFNRNTDPNGGGGALSAFKGVLKAGNITAANGGKTVVFTLDAPTAAFPYLCSNTTYQTIIQPSTYKLGQFAKGGTTTGPFRLTSYTSGVGAKFDRNPTWWGGKAPLDGVDVTYYSDTAAVTAALLGGQIDMISQVQFSDSRALFNNSNVQIITAKGTPHREISMLVSTAAAVKPFKDRSRPAGSCSHARPADDHQAAVQRLRHPRERRAVRVDLPVVRPDRPAAEAGSRAGEEAAHAGWISQGLPGHADDPEVRRDPGSSRRSSRPRRRRSASTSSSTSSRAARTTAARTRVARRAAARRRG